MKRKILLTAVTALALSMIGGAYAAKHIENDELAISGAKLTLTQAVSAAERHVGGKASRAEYERHKGQWVFDVEVVKGSKVMDVRVDPTSGKVIAAVEDKIDHEYDDEAIN